MSPPSPSTACEYAARNLLPSPNCLLSLCDAGAKSQISLTPFQQQKELAESTGSLRPPQPPTKKKNPRPRSPTQSPVAGPERRRTAAGEPRVPSHRRLPPRPTPRLAARPRGWRGTDTQREHSRPGAGARPPAGLGCAEQRSAATRGARSRGEAEERGARSEEPGGRLPAERSSGAAESSLGARSRGARSLSAAARGARSAEPERSAESGARSAAARGARSCPRC